ncbi:MAG: hypothetical protein VKK43_09715 [Synechococcaceae cyanobacterium]|nr:hypothetical protein [Synechococcaceae cyanobacterium]
MQRLRRNHRQRPPLLPQLRQQALTIHTPRPSRATARSWWGRDLRRSLQALLLAIVPLAAAATLWLGAVAPAGAAEVLQVTGPDRLLIGDRNRSSSVRLGCLAVAPEDAAQATALLRKLLPRHRRVNLRPLGVHDGELLARLTPIEPDGDDPAEALVAAGLASAVPCA